MPPIGCAYGQWLIDFSHADFNGKPRPCMLGINDDANHGVCKFIEFYVVEVRVSSGHMILRRFVIVC